MVKILPKLGFKYQQLWDILSSTNINNLHPHEATPKVYRMNPCFIQIVILFLYLIYEKKLHIFYISLIKQSWSSSCLSCMTFLSFCFLYSGSFLFTKVMCESLLSFAPLPNCVLTTPNL